MIFYKIYYIKNVKIWQTYIKIDGLYTSRVYSSRATRKNKKTNKIIKIIRHKKYFFRFKSHYKKRTAHLIIIKERENKEYYCQIDQKTLYKINCGLIKIIIERIDSKSKVN